MTGANIKIRETREDWMDFAACAGHPNREVFHPEVGDHESRNKARRIGATCPVYRHCLDYALRNFERIGIWGGLTERERRVVKSGVRVDKCAKCRMVRIWRDQDQKVCDVCQGLNFRTRLAKIQNRP